MASFKAENFKLIGEKLNVGDDAPNFELYNEHMEMKTLDDWKGKTIIISVVPSIDTRVCDIQTKTFNQKYNNDEDVVVLTVSVDLPFAFSRWCESNNKNAIILSDYRDNNFGKSYGVLMDPYMTLYRSIFVVDKNKKIALAAYNEDVGQPVKFEEVYEVVEKLK
ncbi:MAG: thiol peroxidase [Mycoplasmoidaceae bacterium]